MIRLAIDEDFNNNILRGVVRRNPDVDIVRVQDAGLSGADDATILEWSAQERRVLLTHDVSTMTKYAIERVESGQSMPGLFQVGQSIPIARAIEDILLLAECSFEAEWEGQVRYLPL